MSGDSVKFFIGRHNTKLVQKPQTHCWFEEPYTQSLHIPPEEWDDAMQMMFIQRFEMNLPIHLTEKMRPIRMPVYDIDIKNEIDVSRRVYTFNDVQNIVKTMMTALKKITSVPDDRLHAYVLERTGPYQKDGYWRDGIHVAFPLIGADVSILRDVYFEVLRNANVVLQDLKNINTVNKCLDIMVVEDKCWMAYGSSKVGCEPYLLTHIFDFGMNQLEIPKPSIELMKFMSQHKDFSPIIVGRSPAQVAQVLAPLGQDLATSEDWVAQLVSILNKNRFIASCDTDKERAASELADVGMALYNINRNNYRTWEGLARSLGHGSEEILAMWEKFEGNDSDLTDMCLHRMAEIDDKVAYDAFNVRRLRAAVIASKDGTSTNVATVLNQLFKHRFKCLNIKHKEWFEFRGHRWHPCEQGHALMSAISSQPGRDLITLYLKVISQLTLDAQKDDITESMRNDYVDSITKLASVLPKLRTITFKESLMKECYINGFLDENLTSKMHAKRHLLGMNNGVWDLNKMVFRNGRPEDYVQLTCGFDWRPRCEDDAQYEAEIHRFHEQIFPDADTRAYMWVEAALKLPGGNPNEELKFFIGSGGNGKSKYQYLNKSVLGGYSTKLGGATITQKRLTTDKPNPEMAQAWGVRDCEIDEIEANSPINVAVAKELVGGDVIKVRGLYASPFEFYPQFKLTVSGNSEPVAPWDDGGFWRRAVEVIFEARFVDNPNPASKFIEFKRDNSLTEKMKNWKIPYFNMLIQKLRDLKESGARRWEKYYPELDQAGTGVKSHLPIKVVRDTANYRNNLNVFAAFMSRNIKEDNTSTLKLTATYAHFKKWMLQNYGDIPLTVTKFKTQMESVYGVYNSATGWKGLALVIED